MFFFSSEPLTMEALEAYVMREYNRADPDKIGGVSFMSLRIPIPPQGSPSPATNASRSPIIPKTKTRKVWYVTPHETVLGRCKEGDL